MKLRCLLLIVLALVVGGSASGIKATVKDIDWGSRIGTYTYEEALAELGEPDVIGQSREGKIAEWGSSAKPQHHLRHRLRQWKFRPSHVRGGGGGIRIQSGDHGS
jgi:hypothetical protein